MKLIFFEVSYFFFYLLDSYHYFLQVNPAMQRYAPFHSFIKKTKNLLPSGHWYSRKVSKASWAGLLCIWIDKIFFFFLLFHQSNAVDVIACKSVCACVSWSSLKTGRSNECLLVGERWWRDQFGVSNNLCVFPSDVDRCAGFPVVGQRLSSYPIVVKAKVSR